MILQLSEEQLRVRIDAFANLARNATSEYMSQYYFWRAGLCHHVLRQGHHAG